MKIIYIAGSISDGDTLPIEERKVRIQAFADAEAALSEKGFIPLNPMRRGVSETKVWLDYMRESLVDISQADCVALLPNWQKSRGARIEYDLVTALGIPAHSLWYVLDKETPA